MGILLLFLLLSTGCGKSTEARGPLFFQDESEYHVQIECKDIKTEGIIFFDRDGSVHLIHQDKNSPLYGLEEIFTETGVQCKFHGMELEHLPYYGGTGHIGHALQILRTQAPEQMKKEKNGKRYVYNTDSVRLELLCTSKSDPIRITGQDFQINFHTSA